MPVAKKARVEKKPSAKTTSKAIIESGDDGDDIYKPARKWLLPLKKPLVKPASKSKVSACLCCSQLSDLHVHATFSIQGYAFPYCM